MEIYIVAWGRRGRRQGSFIRGGGGSGGGAAAAAAALRMASARPPKQCTVELLGGWGMGACKVDMEWQGGMATAVGQRRRRGVLAVAAAAAVAAVMAVAAAAARCVASARPPKHC